jgi:DhnA family fructose-bisphosphate aldolase class Ia
LSSLDHKLARIRAGSYAPADFIIADAKDGDMGFGLTAPGPRRDAEGCPGFGIKSRRDYLAAMAEMTRSGLVDIMLTSVSSAEALRGDGALDGTAVTLAVRLNDATDIWSMRGAGYKRQPSRPFATAELRRARDVADLGLYSVTFSNDLERDLASLEAYKAFRREAHGVGMRHFLEVFNPAFDIGLEGAALGHYVNDAIVRSLAGVAARDRPLFLKMVYNGPAALEELAAYDPAGLIVGILGGAAGTTRDTFELVRQAERHGGRVALFGRKINLAEAPVALVGLMRRVVEGEIGSAEAVRAYHDTLARAGLTPDRGLDADLEITDPILANG